MTASPPAPDSDESRTIVCPTSKWYARRMGLMMLVVFGISIWFLVDGVFRYPDKIEAYSAYRMFEERSETYRRLEREGRLHDWPVIAEDRGWGIEAPPPEWEAYSMERGWPLEPDERHPGDDTAQLVYAGITAALGAGLLGAFLLSRRRTLTADRDTVITPKGVRVPISSIFRIDKRKWPDKGLAYLHYRTADGATRRATIDDLKFTGADRVLDRVLASFRGELVETVEEPADPGETPPAGTPDPPDPESGKS